MIYTIVLGVTTLLGILTTFYFKKKFNRVEVEINALLQVYNSDEGKVIQESFLKFVSDSREWAYQYIEDVQEQLQNFKSLVKHDIDYFNKYGEVGSAYPHYDAMKRICSAYTIIENILPKEDDVKT
jgi:hypothetical protein